MANIIQFPNKSEISSEEQKLLRSVVIEDKKPGTLLYDFNVLTEFIGDGIRVSDKNNLLPMNALMEINAKMARPIETGLKRPAQRSFPHINGLYLLLRASGLTRICGVGTKKILLIDKDVYDSWKKLNQTEQYFTLLEAWLLLGSPQIIGESGGSFADEAIFKWDTLFKNIAAKGLKVFGNSEAEQNILYFVGTYTIGILELFGFISVTPVKPEPGKGWQIDKIQKTPLGIALLNLLSDKLFPKEADTDNFAEFLDEMMDEDEDKPVFDLQSVIRPYFPKWENVLQFSEKEFQDGVYLFKVSLDKTIWRKIAIPAKSELEQLSTAILKAFNFDDDHLYCFTHKDRFGLLVKIYHPYMEDEEICADEVMIGDLPLEPGAVMEYLYDFGDNWKFEVMLESVQPSNFRMKKARVIESHGKAPEQYWYGDEEDDSDDEE
jgi:hypothetical protein